MKYKVNSKKKQPKTIQVGKIKLTSEEKSRTQHLPYEQAVVVPSTYGVESQKKISDKEMTNRVDNVRRHFSDNYGGYTSVKATGGYVLDKNGKLVKEKVVKVTSFSTRKNYNKNHKNTFKQVSKWGDDWKQETIAYENEGDLYFVKPKEEKKSKK